MKRIVANLHAPQPADAVRFYRDVLGLDLVMDHGWIATFGSEATMSVQVSVASEGGSRTPTPALSIEVDDVEEALRRVHDGGFAVEYGPIDEPWGVHRFFVRDPLGNLVNILAHR